MPQSQTQAVTGTTDELFDRYTLPKVALAIILLASLVGTWVTTTLNGHSSASFIVAKWGYFVALGVLTGGLVWKHVFVRPADLGSGATEYCEEMSRRFDRITAGALGVLAIGGPVVLVEYRSMFGQRLAVFGYGVLLIVFGTLMAVTTRQSDTAEAQFRSRIGLLSLALAIGVVVATAVAEVALRGFDPVAAVVRVVHFLAFAVWIGGAVWNIFVAVPTGKKRPTTAVVRAAGEQLERFRWAVRFIIPTLLLTGLYQAVDGLGTSVGTYLGGLVGLAILAKVGFIGALVVIFKLCPMWRACSPIEGVCDLENLGGSESDNTLSTAGRSEVTGDD